MNILQNKHSECVQNQNNLQNIRVFVCVYLFNSSRKFNFKNLIYIYHNKNESVRGHLDGAMVRTCDS